MAGGIGDGVMPRQIRLPMPTCKAQASKAAIHDVARLPRIPAIPAQAVDMAGGKHRDHLQYSTDKPDSTGDRG